MFSFKVFARTFPAICIIAGAFMLFVGNAQAGWFLLLMGFISFVIALLAKKLR